MQIQIVQGEAVVKGDELRCVGTKPRRVRPDQTICNRLIARVANGQLAGGFFCERCRQEVIVKMKSEEQDDSDKPAETEEQRTISV